MSDHSSEQELRSDNNNVAGPTRPVANSRKLHHIDPIRDIKTTTEGEWLGMAPFISPQHADGKEPFGGKVHQFAWPRKAHHRSVLPAPHKPSPTLGKPGDSSHPTPSPLQPSWLSETPSGRSTSGDLSVKVPVPEEPHPNAPQSPVSNESASPSAEEEAFARRRVGFSDRFLSSLVTTNARVRPLCAKRSLPSPPTTPPPAHPHLGPCTREWSVKRARRGASPAIVSANVSPLSDAWDDVTAGKPAAKKFAGPRLEVRRHMGWMAYCPIVEEEEEELEEGEIVEEVGGGVDVEMEVQEETGS